MRNNYKIVTKTLVMLGDSSYLARLPRVAIRMQKCARAFRAVADGLERKH